MFTQLITVIVIFLTSFLPFIFTFTSLNIFNIFYTKRNSNNYISKRNLNSYINQLYKSCDNLRSKHDTDTNYCYFPLIYLDINMNVKDNTVEDNNNNRNKDELINKIKNKNKYFTVNKNNTNIIKFNADVYSVQFNDKGVLDENSCKKVEELSNVNLFNSDRYSFDYNEGIFNNLSLKDFKINKNLDDGNNDSLVVSWRDKEDNSDSFIIENVFSKTNLIEEPPMTTDELIENFQSNRNNYDHKVKVYTMSNFKYNYHNVIEKMQKVIQDLNYKSMKVRHYDVKSNAVNNCLHLHDGFWPDSSDVTDINLDILEFIEKKGTPAYIGKPIKGYILCKNGKNLGNYKCDDSEFSVYGGKGKCWDTDKHTLTCMSKWIGYRFALPEINNQYVVCKEFDKTTNNNYTIKKCFRGKIFNEKLQMCVNESLYQIHNNIIDSHNHIHNNCLKHEVKISKYDRYGNNKPENKLIKFNNLNFICADPRCLEKNPIWEYVDYDCINEFDHINLVKYPGSILKCDETTLRVKRTTLQIPRFKLIYEPIESFRGLYVTYYLPTLCFEYVIDYCGKGEVKTIFPQTWKDIDSALFKKQKLRVSHKIFGPMMDFCALSLHTHVFNSRISGPRDYSLCTVAECCVPEVLDDNELRAIEQSISISKLPFFACSWVEKRKLFKWDSDKKIFIIHRIFDTAIGIYSNHLYKRSLKDNLLFQFDKYIEPTTNYQFDYESLYNYSNDITNPSTILGYTWRKSLKLNRKDDVGSETVLTSTNENDDKKKDDDDKTRTISPSAGKDGKDDKDEQGSSNTFTDSLSIAINFKSFPTSITLLNDKSVRLHSQM